MARWMRGSEARVAWKGVTVEDEDGVSFGGVDVLTSQRLKFAHDRGLRNGEC
jgi:hypothetical protein